MATPTPVRHLPGAFINTPAPANDATRRNLFGDATAGGPRLGPLGRDPSRPAPGPPQPPGPPAQPGLQLIPDNAAQPPVLRAAKVVNDLLQSDERYPELNSLCHLRTSSEYDLAMLDPGLAPFHKPTMYPIPDRVFENFDRGQIATSMGLFTEINHAWVTIDNALYLWDYTHPDPELIGYEESPHTITTLALVRPKGDVFVNTITHILVLATATEMILLGVSATPTPNGSHTVNLYSTRMTLHKGSLDVSYIVGSADGRIFFGGNNDTDVHELYYQQEEKWFSSRCGKINHTHPGWSSVVPKLPHPSTLLPSPSSLWTPKTNESLADMVIDDSRKLLYTLSNTSTIRVYQIEGLYKLNKCIEKDRTTCFNETTHFVSGSPLLTNNLTIVSISPISAKESFNLHLVALTSTGCRIFLSATSSSSTSGSAPQSMQVQFVKFPPSADQAPQAQQAGDGAFLNVSSQALTTSRFGQRFAPGYFFDFVAKADNPNTDILFVAAPDTGRIKLQHSSVAQNDRAMRYHESANFIDLGQGVRVLAVGSITPPFAAAGQPVGFGNELAVQFDQAPSEFAIMTNMGIHIIRRRRMVDIFATVIRKAASEDTVKHETTRFIHLYGRNETVSTALAIACGQGNDLRNGAARVIDQVTQDRARSVFIDFGGDPTVTETDSINLSARHHALGLYLTRLVRMLWKSRVISQGLDAAGAVSVRSSVPLTKLNSVQENLDRLRNFLETNRGVIKGLNGPQDLANAQNRLAEIAMQSEHQGLHSLQRLMRNIAEGISFVLMLFDERVAEIFVRLDAPTQTALRELTYEQLFSQEAGRDLAKLLVKAIVNRNIESGANVETVADALRRRCGSFCSPDDVVVFKAQEQLKRASEQAGNPNHLRQLLGESLRLFERVAGSLTLANLHGAVQQYLDLQYYAGAIQLCLRVAQEKDRGNTALSWINDGRPPNDARQAAFNERRSCYDLVHEVMQRLDAASAREPELVDGRPTLAATKRNEAYNVVNGSDDEVFHFDLYEWYIEQNWTDRILAIDSPHVITFLQRLAATEAHHADLLCRFYTHRGRFYEAAEVQAELAKNEVLEIGIKDRITLLSRAKGNASVSTVGISRQHQQVLNHDVTTLLEIAHIQDDLLERLKADGRIPDDRKRDCEQALNGPILSLTELFNGFAEPANYYDLSLLIYHAADHHAPRLIADTWRSLINAAHYETEEAYRTWQERGRPADEADVGPPPLPYEHVVNKVQDIAHRTSMNNHVFPIDTVLTILCEYAINEHQNEEIQADPTWPVLLFVNNLGVAHAIVTRVLERILDAQEAPFTGRRRKAVVRWILMACELWVREVERRGLDGQQGGGNIGRWTVQLLSRAVEAMREIAATERAANRPEHELEAQGLMAAAMELAAKINQVLGLEEARPGRGGW
ncbi:putative nuclear pore complex protein [Diaporthe sp. PMI_573]|nr:putative nuclear pore complex protein [Diaporthaceae sp. PMI_573]